MTPKEWYDMTIGRSYNTDGAYGYQCWDYFDYFKRYMKLDGFSTYCGITGYAGDIWNLRNTNGASKYFDFISPANIKEGDWLFWGKTNYSKGHVAFYYGGREVGQNQAYPRNTVTSINLNRNGLIGAFRYKNWSGYEKGVATGFSYAYKGLYQTVTAVNLRTGGSEKYKIIKTLEKGTTVQCYGYYAKDEKGRTWLYVSTDYGVGFVCIDYMKEVK